MKHMSKHESPKLIVPVARLVRASCRASGQARSVRDRAEVAKMTEKLSEKKKSTGAGGREAPGRQLSDIRGVDCQGTFNHESIPLLAHHSLAELK
jgi:hypothetical protein